MPPLVLFSEQQICNLVNSFLALNISNDNIEDLKNLVAVVANFEHTECSAASHNKKRKVLGTVGEFNDITRSIVHQAKM